MGKQKIQSRFVWKGGLFCCELMCDVCVLRVSFILLSFMYLFFVTVFFNDCFVCSVWSGAWLDSLVQSTTYHYRHYSWPISRPPRCIKNEAKLFRELLWILFNLSSYLNFSSHFTFRFLLVLVNEVMKMFIYIFQKSCLSCLANGNHCRENLAT